MVILLDKHKKPLGFITEKRLRQLCERRRAVIYRMFPCVAILMDKDARSLDGLLSYRIKIDPGARYTGLCIVCNETEEVVFFTQLWHHGEAVKHNLSTRHAARRSRRNRETQYRRCKYKGGRDYDSFRKPGWLPPSVKSTADNILNWVRRMKKWVNLTECSVEAVRFDTQLMDSPDIEGMEYQHGTLFGYELREYLLEKYGHRCQYCEGASGDNILEWEHIIPKSRGGSNSVKNATLSCRACNKVKGNRLPNEWLADIRDSGDESELSQARARGIARVMDGVSSVPNRYAAWVNSSRRYLEAGLFAMFPAVECSSGGRTKYNREQVLKLPKDHHYDALCVGTVPEAGYKDRTGGYVLIVEAKGRGSRLRGNVNECGIITVKYKSRQKTHKGFMTGDMVIAEVPSGKHKGRHIGRITIRHTGSFGMTDIHGKRHDINCKYMSVLQKADGYSYHYEKTA